MVTGVHLSDSCLCVLRRTRKCGEARAGPVYCGRSMASALPHFACVGPGSDGLMRLQGRFGLSDVTKDKSRVSGVGGLLC